MTIPTAVDPITFEVIKHRLWQINDEQALAIKTISASPIVVEGNDFNVGLFTCDGELVTAGFGSSVHVGTLSTTIRNIMKKASSICDGDIFLTNDPFLGALHQNDVVVASPMFWDGEIVLWIGNVLHHPDVGGIDEGSFCINAKNLFQEPTRYFFKIVDQGTLVSELEHTFVTNSRLPDMVALDLRAQIGAIYVAKERLFNLIEMKGHEVIKHVMSTTLKISENQLREQYTKIPDGSWTGEAYMDGVRVGNNQIVKVHLTLTKKNDQLIFDYTGSDPQVDAAVNCTYHGTVAGSAVPIYSFLCRGNIDWNDGVINTIDVIAPEGTVTNATFPAPVSICTVGFRWLVTVAATQAVAKMFDVSDGFQSLVCPSWVVSANCNNIYTYTEKGKRIGALLSDHRAGGAAARSFADGFSHAGQITSFSSNLGNVEGTEWKLPILYLYRRQLMDSGGPGQFRGGLTAQTAFIPFNIEKLLYKSTNTAGTIQSNASGLRGGYPGAGSQVMILRNSNIQKYIANGLIPESISDLEGELEYLPSKADGDLSKSDIYIFHAPGGGGYGDPIKRDVMSVKNDVENGWVSRERAKQNYGVILNEENRVDITATKKMRDTILQKRKKEIEQIHHHDDNSLCVHCGHNKEMVHIRKHLQEAGPWLALKDEGVSKQFELEEKICTHCLSITDVREVYID